MRLFSRFSWFAVALAPLAASWSCSEPDDSGGSGNEAGHGTATGGTNGGSSGSGGRNQGGTGQGGRSGSSTGGEPGGNSGAGGDGGDGDPGASGHGGDGDSGASGAPTGGTGGSGPAAGACSPNPCEHSGACRDVSAAPRCKCSVGFSGERCEHVDGLHFTRVATLDHFVCGLLVDGSLDCRGGNEFGEASPPPGAFRDFSVNTQYTCAVRTNGELTCFGDDREGATATPSGTFTAVSTSTHGNCAVSTAGEIVCWGLPSVARSPLAGTFTDVSVGSFVCGVRADGSVACADSHSASPITVPAEAAHSREVSVGAGFVCALLTNAGVVCWGGDYSLDLYPTYITGTFTHISSGMLQHQACGVHTDGSLECWDVRREERPPYRPVVVRRTYSGTFTDVSLGEEVLCALRSDGVIVCTSDPDPELPTGTFSHVAASDVQLCAVKSNLDGVCYGVGGWGGGAFTGPFAKLSAVGGGATCGILSSGAGFSGFSSTPPPSGTFIEIAAGSGSSPSGCCGVRDTGALACWNVAGETVPVSGAVTRVAASSKNGCAIRVDGSIACWGENRLGQSTPPSGTFRELAVGPNHGCATRTDGTAACWGRNDDGEATPPPGEFTRLAARGAHTCGLRPNGTIDCWGANGAGQSAPPSGRFTEVSLGGLYSCGLTPAGEIVCWGDRRLAYGKLLPN